MKPKDTGKPPRGHRRHIYVGHSLKRQSMAKSFKFANYPCTNLETLGHYTLSCCDHSILHNNAIIV